MTSRRSRGRGAAQDGTDPDFFFGDSRRKQGRRKDFQLCGQVQRAIADALGELGDEVLGSLWVARVEPAPTASQFMVWVAMGDDVRHGLRADAILARIARVEGFLRAEVAAATRRKQVPTLPYAVWTEEPGA